MPLLRPPGDQLLELGAYLLRELRDRSRPGLLRQLDRRRDVRALSPLAVAENLSVDAGNEDGNARLERD